MKQYRCLSDIKRNIIDGNINCVQLVNEYLNKIKHSKSNSFIEVYKETALDQAKEIDQKITQNTAGKLAGMIIGIKDNISYKSHSLTASSAILENFEVYL